LFGPVGTFSILRKVSMPSMTLPKTTCFPSRKSQVAVVTKNYTSPVKKGGRGGEGGIEKKTRLAAIRVGTRVGLFGVSVLRSPRDCQGPAHHRQKSWSGMFHLKILILQDKNEFEQSRVESITENALGICRRRSKRIPSRRL
jgi:hypothetical protein